TRVEQVVELALDESEFIGDAELAIHARTTVARQRIARMRVDQAGHDDLVTGVDDLRIPWIFDAPADIGDLAVVQDDDAVVDVLPTDGDDLVGEDDGEMVLGVIGGSGRRGALGQSRDRGRNERGNNGAPSVSAGHSRSRPAMRRMNPRSLTLGALFV